MRLSDIDTMLVETSKLTKLKQAIYGMKGNKGIAILTPQNPNGGAESLQAKQDMSTAELNQLNRTNNQLLKDGKKLLSDLGYNYYTQKGVFEGETETSLIVFDITVEDAYDLGRKWKQTAIIYIQPNKNPKYREFVFIPTAGAKHKNPRAAVISLVRSINNLPQEATDNMSQLGGSKYLIPFFDSAAEYEAEFGEKSKHKRKAGKEHGTTLFTKKSGESLPPVTMLS